MRPLTEEQFLKDVATHEMTVLRDDGIYRHLRFRNPACSWNQWFEIVTWPWRLVYTGDMGTFAFTRLEDMFQFFRTAPRGEVGLHINPGYWGEKLVAVDRDGRESSETRFSFERFKEHVEQDVTQWIEEGGLDNSGQKELREALEEMFSEFEEDDERGAHEAVSRFSCEIGAHRFGFEDTWEWNCREASLRFLWCCYAIAWAIARYDARCSAPESASERVA